MGEGIWSSFGKMEVNRVDDKSNDLLEVIRYGCVIYDWWYL